MTYPLSRFQIRRFPFNFDRLEIFPFWIFDLISTIWQRSNESDLFHSWILHVLQHEKLNLIGFLRFFLHPYIPKLEVIRTRNKSLLREMQRSKLASSWLGIVVFVFWKGGKSRSFGWKRYVYWCAGFWVNVTDVSKGEQVEPRVLNVSRDFKGTFLNTLDLAYRGSKASCWAKHTYLLLGISNSSKAWHRTNSFAIREFAFPSWYSCLSTGKFCSEKMKNNQKTLFSLFCSNHSSIGIYFEKFQVWGETNHSSRTIHMQPHIVGHNRRHVLLLSREVEPKKFWRYSSKCSILNRKRE